MKHETHASLGNNLFSINKHIAYVYNIPSCLGAKKIIETLFLLIMSSGLHYQPICIHAL